MGEKTQKLLITQTRSCIATPKKIKLVMRGLGLKGIGRTVEQKDNNCIRGMVNKVKHLVEYEIKQS